MAGIIEGILFVVGNEGIDKEHLMCLLDVDEKTIDEQIEVLRKIYSSKDHGLSIELFANKYKLTTKKEHKEYYQKLAEVEKNEELSQSALETLAVIAYNSPITRAKVDEIRGIDSAYQIRKLVYRNLIKDIGRSDLPGRPILYSVTDAFLDYLGLSSLEQLPKLEEIEIEDDKLSDLYNSKYQEN